MSTFLGALTDRLETEDASVLLHEVAAAFDEADPASAARTDPRARALHELVRFCRFDAIAGWLRDEPEAVARALAFARKVGETQFADMLASALAGTPQPAVTFSVTLPGQAAQPLEVDGGEATRFDGKDWGGTDIALSFAIHGFEREVVRELARAADAFPLQPPLAVRMRAGADAMIGTALARQSAAQLFAELVHADQPAMLAGTWEAMEKRVVDGAVTVPIEHVARPPAAPALLAAMATQYGPVAADLLAVYAQHDGADLFCHEGEPGFVLGPIASWPELLERAIDWAQDVTWNDEPEEIPPYLYSSIAFGMIPGDAERWLLVTEGKHAGRVMLSDTGLIEDRTQFDSIGEFFAALLHDPARVLNCGGYVRYNVGDEQLFPIQHAPTPAKPTNTG